jgi:tetratricopeptide (TPR) repeat protein
MQWIEKISAKQPSSALRTVFAGYSRRVAGVSAVVAAALVMLTLAGCGHKSVDDDLAAGDQAMQNTKLADAEKAYQDAAAVAPTDPRPHVALGNLYVFEQKPGAAETEYMKVLEFDPHNAPAHTALGSIYSAQSQLGLAEGQYRAAVALEPANVTYRINLGTLLQKAGKFGPGEAELRTATGLEPKNAHAHLALANLYAAETDRGADAAAEFALVKQIDPSLMPSTAGAPPPTGGEGSPSAATSPAVSSTPATPPEAAAPPPSAPPANVRAVNRKFLLTHDSPVYETPSDAAVSVAQVHRGKFVHVTGITGSWFRIQMRNGTVGFIPVSAAE